MLKKILKFLGFEEETGAYFNENRRRRPLHSTTRDDMRGNAYSSNYEDYDDERYERSLPLKNGLIFFKGLPSAEDKLLLREALFDGCIILLDLSDVSPEKREAGNQFLTFMQGVSFASNGELNKLNKKNLFYVSPQPGMVQIITGTNTNKQGDEV